MIKFNGVEVTEHKHSICTPKLEEIFTASPGDLIEGPTGVKTLIERKSRIALTERFTLGFLLFGYCDPVYREEGNGPD